MYDSLHLFLAMMRSSRSSTRTLNPNQNLALGFSPPMEFRYRAGDQRDPSLLSDPAFAHPSSDSAAKSILGAHFDGRTRASDLKVTMRELEKKLIREARELERLMGMGFVRVPFKDELLSGGIVIDVSDDSGDDNAALREAVSACSEVSQLEQQASCGMKRKAAPLPVCSSSSNKLICRKTASSDLGQATTTSTQLLKAHLKGNQPKATTTSTQLLKAHLKGNQPKLKPYMVGPDAEVRDSLPLGLKEVFMQANGRTHRLLQGVHCLWCTTCKVSCNGVLTMITHLSGKKHAKATKVAGILAC